MHEVMHIVGEVAVVVARPLGYMCVVAGLLFLQLFQLKLHREGVCMPRDLWTVALLLGVGCGILAVCRVW